MKNFIEIKSKEGKPHLININHIMRVSTSNMRGTYIAFSVKEQGIVAQETYEEVLKKIEEANK
ncbi:MAG: hypothetical protein ACK5M0_01900 [Bacteroidales bacterium]